MSSTISLNNDTPITNLVDLYRSGLPPAAEMLLNRFGPYLHKWDRLLVAGRWDHKDREIQHFLQMMGSGDLDRTLSSVFLKLKAYEKDDIEQEIRVVFLEVALRTESIRKHYRYRLQSRLVVLMKDPLVFRFGSHESLDDTHTLSHDTIDIDEAWVAGYTCGRGFDELTPQERKVIQLHHYYGATIECTAHALGIGTATVSRVISKAKKILASHYSR